MNANNTFISSCINSWKVRQPWAVNSPFCSPFCGNASIMTAYTHARWLMLAIIYDSVYACAMANVSDHCELTPWLICNTAVWVVIKQLLLNKEAVVLIGVILITGGSILHHHRGWAGLYLSASNFKWKTTTNGFNIMLASMYFACLSSEVGWLVGCVHGTQARGDHLPGHFSSHTKQGTRTSRILLL